MDSFENYQLDPEVGAVIMGNDTSFTMTKLCIASLYINTQKCKFILTNTDRFTMVNGRKFPGCGTLLEGILITLKDKSYEVAGKPNPFTMQLIKEKFSINPLRTIMVGNNPDTDVLFGKASGVHTCLVMTGVVKNEDNFYNFY